MNFVASNKATTSMVKTTDDAIASNIHHKEFPSRLWKMHWYLLFVLSSGHFFLVAHSAGS